MNGQIIFISLDILYIAVAIFVTISSVLRDFFARFRTKIYLHFATLVIFC